MPVIPSFGNFAKTPDVAQSYLAGARIAQDAAQEGQRIQLQRERLQQDALQAQMELEAKKELAHQQQLRQEAQMEIEKAYKDAQIGLRAQEVKAHEEQFQFKVQSAARQFQAQQIAQRRILAGEDPTSVWLEMGPQAGVGLPTGLFRTPESTEGLGQITHPEARPDLDIMRTGPRSFARVPPPAINLSQESAKPATGVPGHVVFGNKLVKLSEPPEVKEAKQELKALVSQHHWLETGEEPESKSDRKAATSLRKQYQDLKAIIRKGATSTGTSTTNEVIRRTKDNRRAVFNADTKEFIRYAD